ncbi:MAG: GREB1-related protein [Planctomycetota bacterium]|jgi:hypothetical protein
MSERAAPRYPIYVPSKGRAGICYTARFLQRDGVPFSLVVEKPERAAYEEYFPEARILELPFTDCGLIAARNWIKAHAIKAGAVRHWQIDDNIRGMWRRNKGLRIRCASGIAFACVEDFVDRYQNVAVAGMNYYMFAPDHQEVPPFYRNVHVYSCTLILNEIPYAWRTPYNDDTDLCLQALAGGWCTILVNAFLAWKMTTMTVEGGNTEDLYKGDGRLKMARALERLWPGVVRVSRRYGRPQHVVNWRKFDNELRLRPDLPPPDPDRYSMDLVQVKPEIRSPEIQQLLKDGG